jgi:glucose dehydrogenase
MQSAHRWRIAALTILCLPGSLLAQAPGGNVDAAPAASVAPGDWTTYGGNLWNQRYSPLTKITTRNVGQLVARMVFQTGIPRLGSFENTPIVIAGVMYVTTPYNTAMAYDLATQKELWRYEHKLGTTIYCCARATGCRSSPHAYMDARRAPRGVRPMTARGVGRWFGDPTYSTAASRRPLVVDDVVIMGVRQRIRHAGT